MHEHTSEHERKMEKRGKWKDKKEMHRPKRRQTVENRGWW